MSTDVLALALKAQELGRALAACAVIHAHVVNAYRDARADAIDWNMGR